MRCIKKKIGSMVKAAGYFKPFGQAAALCITAKQQVRFDYFTNRMLFGISISYSATGITAKVMGITPGFGYHGQFVGYFPGGSKGAKVFRIIGEQSGSINNLHRSNGRDPDYGNTFFPGFFPFPIVFGHEFFHESCRFKCLSLSHL